MDRVHRIASEPVAQLGRMLDRPLHEVGALAGLQAATVVLVGPLGVVPPGVLSGVVSGVVLGGVVSPGVEVVVVGGGGSV